MTDYECPRCGTGYDAIGIHNDDAGEHECEECGFTFIVDVEYEPSYTVTCKMHSFGGIVSTATPHRVCKLCQCVQWEP